MIASEQLRREVYGLLGVPIDAADMATALLEIRKAAGDPSPFLISTVNLNFLISSQTDSEFRESLLMSDLCTADGMPIIWLGRLLGIPFKERIAGADIFDKLRTTKGAGDRLNLFLFGGKEGAAAAACKRLNAESSEVTCVGFLYPGFGAVNDMSTPETIETINKSGANFLIVALGAQKGQTWLRRNHARLRPAVRVHLGAAINYQAGILKRSPVIMQRIGLEWLWRIKEEPQLWGRYWNDGLAFLGLLINHVFPLLLVDFWSRLTARRPGDDLNITNSDDHDSVIINLDGSATAKTVEKAAVLFENACATSKDIVVNFTNTRQIDARFLGLILMLDKHLKLQGQQLRLSGASPRVEKLFRLNGFEFLLRAATK